MWIRGFAYHDRRHMASDTASTRDYRNSTMGQELHDRAFLGFQATSPKISTSHPHSNLQNHHRYPNHGSNPSSVLSLFHLRPHLRSASTLSTGFQPIQHSTPRKPAGDVLSRRQLFLDMHWVRTMLSHDLIHSECQHSYSHAQD